MGPEGILRVVDAICRDKNIGRETVFKAIEAALVAVGKKHSGDKANIVVEIDRTTGSIRATHDGAPMDMGEIVDRIGAQAAKDAIVQEIGEATGPARN